MQDALAERKRALRREAVSARRDAAQRGGGEAASAACDFAFDILAPERGDVIAGFWPMGEEIDTRPLLEALHESGAECCLPVVVTRDAPLIFRRWSPGDPLEPAGFGTSVPGAAAPAATPNKLLVPLLAFDRWGYRLGYGGGYYDRTLASLALAGRIVTVGIAYAAQECDSIPHGEFDVPLDWIVTEREAIYTGRSHASEDG